VTTVFHLPSLPLLIPMKLLTQDLKQRIPALYHNEVNKTPTHEMIVHVRYFCPWNTWVWLGLELLPEEDLFYGYVIGHFPEFGYFSLAELESVRGPMGLRIERDTSFTPKPLWQAVPEHFSQQGDAA